MPAVLVLPVAGTTSTGGTFNGTLSVQRFAAVNNQVVAVAIVAGTVREATGQAVGTFLSGPVTVPVVARPGVSASLAPSSVLRSRVGMNGESQGPDIILAQQQTCGVLHLELGAISLNALGLVVTTTPITLDLSGDAGGPLGALVCQILSVLTNVANLVGLLNTLLGLLGSLTGGLTGGLPV